MVRLHEVAVAPRVVQHGGTVFRDPHVFLSIIMGQATHYTLALRNRQGIEVKSRDPGWMRSLKDGIFEELDIFVLEGRDLEEASSEFRQWKDHSRKEA